MNRRTALMGTWGAVLLELLYLFSLTERPHSTSDFGFASVLIFATILLGGITVFSLPGEKG